MRGGSICGSPTAPTQNWRLTTPGISSARSNGSRPRLAQYDETSATTAPSIARGSDHFVKSALKTSSETIAFNYRMHQVGSDWKITDVYLAGNISQMAQKRSDFAGTLASGGPQGLAKKINALADQTLG